MNIKVLYSLDYIGSMIEYFEGNSKVQWNEGIAYPIMLSWTVVFRTIFKL